jgi:hypothetical protein
MVRLFGLNTVIDIAPSNLTPMPRLIAAMASSEGALPDYPA